MSASERQRMIRVFTELQMVTHKHLIHFTLIFIVTSLPMVYEPAFSWIATLFGAPVAPFMGGALSPAGPEAYVMGMQILRILHRVAAILLLVWAAIFIIKDAKNIPMWEILPKGSLRDAIRELIKYYVRGERPRLGKYNLGQKVYAWSVFVIAVIMYTTGFIMWFRTMFSVEVVEICHLIHSIFFFVLVPALITHILRDRTASQRDAVGHV